MAPIIVDRDARRQSILNAAAEVFAKYGYQRATVDQIATASGIAKGSVYLTFKSKEDIFFTLFEDITLRATDEGLAGAAGKKGGALAKVERVLYEVVTAIDQNEKIIPLTLEFWSVCGVAETRARFGRRLSELYHGLIEQLVDLFKEAEANGEIRPGLPLKSVASSLIAIIDGLLLQQWTMKGVKTSRVLRQSLPVFLHSLKPDPS